MSDLKNKVKARKPGVGPSTQASVQDYQIEQEYLARTNAQEADPQPPMLIKRWSKSRPGTLKGTPFTK